MTRLPLSILACLLGSWLPMPASSAAGTLTIDDYGSLSSVGMPQVSTDGKQVVFTLDDQLYVVAIAGGEPRAITLATSSAWSPQWSDDGSALYFLSDRSGSSQLWKLPVDAFGEAQQVTDLPRGVSTLNMSPDETRLLLSYDDEQPAPDDDDEPGPWVMDRLQFKEDAGDGYLTARPSDHVYVYELAGKALRQITSGPFTEVEPAWSEDGNSVVFVSNRETEPDASYKNDLWVVDADENDAAPRRITNDDSVKSSPAFSPDGKQIAFLSAEDGVYGIYRLMVVPASGGDAIDLTAGLDRWVTSFRYADDGRSIVFLYENRGARQLARVNLASGEIDTILGGERFVSGFDLDSRNRGVVRLATGNGAADLYRLDGGNPRQLTAVNAEFFATHELGKREKVTYRVGDGTEVDAFVTLPPDFDPARRYPAVLHIHGGPVGQFSWGFDFRAEFLAANGYVVLQPNPRGSNGRGQEFVRAIYRTWGITDYPDLIGAIDHAIELGYADPERLAVTGYSYGGYMTNVVITRSQRFDAAASGAGHSLIAANYGHDIYQKWYNWELGPPATNREKYDVLSPFLEVDKATTPTIFLGGREDWNVPVLNAELMYQALRQQGVPARLVVYPDTHHGDWAERYDKDYLERVVAWFDQHVN